MGIDLESLTDYLMECGGPTPSGLRNMMLYADLRPEFKSDEAWLKLVEFAVQLDDEYSLSEEFHQQFAEGVSPQSSMFDNYVLAVLATRNFEWAEPEPLMAYAAYNKSEYKGLTHDDLSEIACLRTLFCLGWDINGRMAESENTALHMLAFTDYFPWTHPRAVAWLLAHGAEPMARNARGDTPLLLLCACVHWTPAMLQSIHHLLLAGADPTAQADDNTSALDQLKIQNEAKKNPMRTALILAMERDIKRSNGFFMSKLSQTPEQKWQDTLAVRDSSVAMQAAR
jgi:hypothetical protein